MSMRRAVIRSILGVRQLSRTERLPDYRVSADIYSEWCTLRPFGGHATEEIEKKRDWKYGSRDKGGEKGLRKFP